MTNREEFTQALLDYVKTCKDFDSFTKEEAMKEVLNVLLNDIGAAQEFIYAIGLHTDLYTVKTK